MTLNFFIRSKSIILLTNFVLFCTSLFGQCPTPSGDCDISITGSSSTDYFLSTGDTLCLTATADYTGIVTLEGGVLINCATNPQTFGITPDGSFPQSDIFNYGVINETGSSNFDKCLLHNYGTYHDPGDLKVQVNSIINNFGIIEVDGKFDLVSTTLLINSGTVTSHGTFTNEGTFNVEGGCMTSNGEFVNKNLIHGNTCGTISIFNNSDNQGTISGDVAIVDTSAPAYPYVDANSGTVSGSVSGTSCGCPGPPCLPSPLIWLKADVGFSAGTWTDQSPNANDGINVGDPTQISNCLNFNPAIQYDGNDETYCDAPELIFMNGNHHINVFCVYEPTVAGTNLGVFGNQGNGGSNNIMLYKGIIGDGAGPLPDYPVPNMYGISPHLLSYTVDEEDNVTGVANSTTAYNNGNLETSFVFNENNSGQIGNDMYVGSSGVHTNKQFFNGKISEFILYESSDGTTSLTETQRLIIQSYLAIKYGFSLGLDYLDSTGEVIKDASDGFNWGVATIGRDDELGLEQKRSRSINNSMNVIISRNKFQDKQFVSLSNNGKDTSHTTEIVFNDRLLEVNNATWKVESSSGVNSCTLELENDLSTDMIICSSDASFEKFEIVEFENGSAELNFKEYLFFKFAKGQKDPIELVELSNN